MRALSVKRPWAGLIFGIKWGYRSNGQDMLAGMIKDVENRPWPLWRYFKKEELPVRVYIHVPLKDDQGALEWLLERGIPTIVVLSLYSKQFITGAIIGEVDIVDCIQDSKSPWAAPGQYHFILATPTLYEHPVPCKGKLGFFIPDIEVVKEEVSR
jgi:hypothetical protein